MNMLYYMKSVSHSFDFCTAWTSECFRLDLNQCLCMRRCLSTKCKSHAMRVDMFDIGISNVLATSDAVRPRLMSPNQCIQAMYDAGSPLDRCMQSMYNYTKPRSTSADQ